MRKNENKFKKRGERRIKIEGGEEAGKIKY